jgi:dTDP-4-dehydrorhamnose reductase
VKALLLGANGQLGRTFVAEGGLARRGSLVLASRDGRVADGHDGVVADLSAPASLPALLDTVRPTLIVNAAAYTAVDKAESEESLATRINGEALAVLGAWAARNHARVVHYSTDYVFDGRATTPYGEDTPTAPQNAYGRSKLAGETALRESGASHLLFRTAWVYSAVGHNFLRTMLRLGAEREELRVVADQLGTPTSAMTIVRASLGAIDRWQGNGPGQGGHLDGTYHLTADGSTSWHAFADAILRGAVARGMLERLPRIVPITTADFPTPAARPAYSVLDTTRFRRAFGLDIPSWETGVEQVLSSLSEAE